MSRKIKNNVIVVTGASGNLGKAICKQFAKSGSLIAALDINSIALIKLKKDLGKEDIEIYTIECDITDKNACQTARNKIYNKWGRIDGLVNNAGITHIERFIKMDKRIEITRKVMEINFFGAVNCTEAFLNDIHKNKGLIVSISSVAGFAPLLGRTAYSASKHALHGFFESLYSEVKEEGIHCLMVCPSFIQAPREIDISPEKNSFYRNKKTIGKNISPDRIAKDIVSCCKKNKPFLVSGKTGIISYFLYRFFPKVYLNTMINKLKRDV